MEFARQATGLNPEHGKKEKEMKTKYFPAAEQKALEVFNGLNALVEKGVISILGPCFTHYQKMFMSKVVKDKDHDWLARRAIVFNEKHHLNFAVKVVLVSVDANTWCTWRPERVIIGKIRSYCATGDDWKIVEVEEISYSFEKEGIIYPSEKPRRLLGPVKKVMPLKEFISQI